MTEPEVLWKPHPGFQVRFLAAGGFEVLGGGAAGPGKTDCLIALAARYAQHPSARGLFLRTNYTDLSEVTDRMQVLYPRLGAKWVEKHTRWEWPSGATTRMGYGETLKEVARYLGHEYTNILYDELGLLPTETPWRLLLSRLRSTDPTVPLRARASANPGGPGHAWLKRRYVDTTEKGARPYVDPDTGLVRQFVPGITTDNPSLSIEYLKILNGLPEPLRSQMKDGDWEAGLGLALQVTPRHLVPAFVPPSYWTQFGAFDWGFRHPFCFGWFAIDEDGQHYLVDTVWGRGQQPPQIAESIHSKVPVRQLQSIPAGHDIFNEERAKSQQDGTPRISEALAAHGIACHKANIARVHGLNTLRRFLQIPANGIPPKLLIMDTPGNRLVYKQLETMVTNPNQPEDVLKVDADDHSAPGESGDDGYDMLRYAMASRMPDAVPDPVGLGLHDRLSFAIEAREQVKIGANGMIAAHARKPETLYTGP